MHAESPKMDRVDDAQPGADPGNDLQEPSLAELGVEEARDPHNDPQEPPKPAEPTDRYTIDATSGLYNRESRSRRGSRSRRSSHHSGSSPRISEHQLNRDKRQRQLWGTRLIALVAIVAAVVLSMLLIRARSELATHDLESGNLATELNRAQGELDQAKQLVAAQEVELGALLKQRIPGTSNLDIDKLYDINNKYVKKVSFSETGVGTAKRLAYYIVLKNSEELPVVPSVTILLFDRKGLQTGMARVTREASTTPTEREQLQPGETRAYSAPVETIRDDAPSYFLVEVH